MPEKGQIKIFRLEEKMENIDIKESGKKLLMITLAMAIDGVSVGWFFLPHNLIVGGVTGIGRVLTSLTGFPVSYMVAALEALMLVLAFVFLGKKYAASIVVASIEYPVFLELFSRMENMKHMTDDILIASICSGLLSGLALGIVIRIGSASGGTDVITLILNRKLGFPLAVTMYTIEAVVLLSQFGISDPEEIILGLISALISTIVVDKVVMAGGESAQVMIFSNKSADIREALISFDVGLTLLRGESGFLGEDRDILLTIVHSRKINAVQNIAQKIDPEAFITISQVRDVKGRGFTLEQVDLPAIKSH